MPSMMCCRIGLPLHLQHRLRDIARQLAHPRAAARREQHRFCDCAHRQMFRRAPFICNLSLIRSASRDADAVAGEIS